ncbi:24065_t:CDS:2 [Cetraspora pellucida]|uniref:24065_t:CDS:1 n=1 Tax=Cetraspora pellucida TaxID=1433469 RepID=A0A9N8VZ38_9GLOM|nr:24065_t:CDS:2 [Cetraspora pellucida]
MLTANLLTSVKLVNSAIETIIKILFEEEQEPPSFSITILIAFNNYNGLSIITLTEINITITVYKSQGLTFSKAVVNLSIKEFTADLLFVTIS